MLRGYKNTAVSLPEIVKVVPNQDVDCSVSGSSFSVSLLCLGCMWYFVFFVFGCQYQCNRLPGKIRLRNYLLYVACDVNPFKPSGIK